MKKEFKYIFRKVVVGVLIVLILGFINKCDVKALSPDIWINSEYTGSGSTGSTLIWTSNICYNQCAFTWNETINEYPYTFHLAQGNPVSTTTNPEGYYFVLVPPDKSFKYYFFVWAHSAYESVHGSPLNIGAVDFDYSNNSLQIKLYNENTDLITSENGGSYVYYNSFILTNKDIEKGISPSFLEEHSFYPARYRDVAPADEYFRLAYTSWSSDSNYSSPLNFYPSKDLFDYLIKDSSTIPFILIDGYTIDSISYDNGLTDGLNGLNKSDQDKMLESILAEYPEMNSFSSWFTLINLPLDFIGSLLSYSENTCSPISIPLPHSNESLQFPCISAIVRNNFGGVYDLIVLVVNGLLFYKLTLSNISFIRGVITPDDDKLEVVDL